MRLDGHRAQAKALLGLALLAQLLCCSGQGLETTSNTRGSLKKAYDRVLQFTKDGVAFRNAYAANPKAACRLNRKSLCGAAAGTDEYVKLQVATSPAEYDARYNAGDNFNPVSPAKDQRPCQTAVAFTITAAAEAAVASALQLNGTSINLSQQDLQFCPGITRGCYDNWDLKSGLERLVNETVVDYQCLPYTAAQSDDPAKLCNYRCRDRPKAIVPGKFGFTPLRDVLSAQKQIRRYGSFVTRFNLYDDFFPWITKTAASNPDAVYDCPNTNKPAADAHTVTVIGYDNTEGYWIVKNSWGPDNGDKGFFRVKFGVCGMMLVGDTYGVFFVPDEQRKMVMTSVAPTTAAGGPKCYIYTAQPGDTLARIADRAVVNLGQLLYDNIDVIRNLNQPLTGVRLRVCNPDPLSITLLNRPSKKVVPPTNRSSTPATSPKPSPKPAIEAAAVTVAAATANDEAAAAEDAAAANVNAATADDAAISPVVPPSPSPSPSPEPNWGETEARILLDLKTSLGDPPGLRWTEGSVPCGDAGVPGWNQVYCSLFGQQQRVYLLDLSSLGITGTLDNAADLTGLTRLQAIWLSGNQLSGSLPADWYKLRNVNELKLDTNAFTGTLPAEWANFRKLRRLYLNNNRLSGTLPNVWGDKLDHLQMLFLASNSFEGTVPASWAQMMKLQSASLYDNPGLNGCLPFDWNAKPDRVKLASGPADSDGTATLTLTGTCLCGYCQDQTSTTCDGPVNVLLACTAAGGETADNVTAAGGAVDAAANDTGADATVLPAPTATAPVAGTAGDPAAATVPSGAGSTLPVGGTAAAAGTVAPITGVAGSTAASGTAANGSAAGAVAPATTAGPAGGVTAAGIPAAATSPSSGTGAVAVGAVPGTTAPSGVTAPSDTGVVGIAGSTPTATAPTATGATTTPGVGAVGVVGATGAVQPAAAPLPNVPAFGAVRPSGSIADAVDETVLPDTRKPNFLAVEDSSGSPVGASSDSSSVTGSTLSR